MERRVQTHTEAVPIMVSECTTPFANRMAKKRALERAKNNLAATPEKRAEVVAAMTQSPRTIKVLKKLGTIKMP